MIYRKMKPQVNLILIFSISWFYLFCFDSISWYSQYSTVSIAVEYCGFCCFVLKTKAEQLSNDFNVKLRNKRSVPRTELLFSTLQTKTSCLRNLIIKKLKIWGNFSSKHLEVWYILIDYCFSPKNHWCWFSSSFIAWSIIEFWLYFKLTWTFSKRYTGSNNFKLNLKTVACQASVSIVFFHHRIL